MNLDHVGQTVQLAANVGVLLSILFLAYQISENRDLTKAQTRSAIASAITGMLSSEALDADLASILYRNANGEELRLARPRMAEIWCRARIMHSPEFVADVDALLPKDRCTSPASPAR